MSKAFGDRLLIDDLSFAVPPGAIVGVIGPNGAGKSTLFRMIQGKEQPDSGEIVIGPTVKIAAVDQTREGLDNSKTVFEVLVRRRRHPHGRTLRNALARLHRPLQLQGRGPAEDMSATCPAASAGGCIWPRP